MIFYFYILLTLLLIILFLLVRNKLRHNLNLVEKIIDKKEAIILDTLRKEGQISFQQLKKETKLSKELLSKHLHDLKNNGMIRITGKGKKKLIELVPYLKH